MSNGTSPEWNIHVVEDWRARFEGCFKTKRPIVFVVGSGLSKSVWSVQRVVDHIREEFGIATDGGSPAEKYRYALEKLGVRSPDDVDRVIRRAVLAATNLGEGSKEAAVILDESPDQYVRECGALERRVDCWSIPLGIKGLVLAIKRIIEKNPSKPVVVITTNFDPLIEVALASNEVAFDTRSLVANQYPECGANPVQIWHIHGTWWDTTLHSAMALGGARAGLKDAILACLEGAEVMVLGYGGWTDVIFETAVEMLEEKKFRSAPTIAWAFYEQDPKTTYSHVLNRFSGGVSGAKVSFFAGIDLHKELPSIMGMDGAPESSNRAPHVVESEDPLREVLEVAKNEGPEQQRQAARELLMETQGGKRINLIRLTKLLCDILDERHGKAREEFALKARKAVKRLALELVEETNADVKAVASCVGDVVQVTVRTPLLVEILQARASHRDPELVPHERGALGKYTLPVDESFEFESGNSNDGNVRDFEAMIWPLVISNSGQAYRQDRDRDVLHGRLGLHREDGHPMTVVFRSGATKAWKNVAQQVPTVAFIELSDHPCKGLLVDEHMLAHRISDFLKKCPSKD